MADTATQVQSDETGETGALTDGFHLVIDALKLNDIDTIYNVPGIPITDLGRYMQAAGMRVLSFRHEQNAGYAASIAGYLTKKPGICMTVSAPGFLNGLTALAHATTNCFPMILISGSSEREIVDLQQGDYEEMDQLAIAKPHCKAAYRILHAEDIGIGIARAIRTAVSGRPGGVYLDLPGKLLGQTMDAAEGAKSLVKVVDAAPRQIPAQDAVDRALDVLRNAKRPLIILGKGAAYAQADDEIREACRNGNWHPPMVWPRACCRTPIRNQPARLIAETTKNRRRDVDRRPAQLATVARKRQNLGEQPKKFVQIDIEPKEMDSNVGIDAPLDGRHRLLCLGSAGRHEEGLDRTARGLNRRGRGQGREQRRTDGARLKNTNMPMDYHGALGALR
ncbi:MAG: thiamine pyrophosphate-binding protein [Thermomicrobiales bacterium]